MPTLIRLQKKDHTLKIRHTSPRIVIKQVGRTGGQGEQGLPGIGIPVGGQAGDILTKTSSADYEAVWAQPIAFSDKYYVANFTVADTVNVNHNLNKYPAVSVMDSTGDEVYGEVDYIDTNSLTVRFAFPFSGRITCN